MSLVAVPPEHRGRGLSGGLLSRALASARDEGATTTTLESTVLGRPTYARLGYVAAGATQMWEHRV